MTDPYVDFFLSASPVVAQLELFEVSHPDFSQVYRIVRNQRGGVTVTLPGGEGLTTFDYRPVRIRHDSQSDDLSQGLTIDIGDPGDLLPAELNAVRQADGFAIKPMVRYWVYRSDQLSSPLVGPLTFEMLSYSPKGGQASLVARAPERNATGTGELYTFARFPMLRGFI